MDPDWKGKNVPSGRPGICTILPEVGRNLIKEGIHWFWIRNRSSAGKGLTINLTETYHFGCAYHPGKEQFYRNCPLGRYLVVCTRSDQNFFVLKEKSGTKTRWSGTGLSSWEPVIWLNYRGRWDLTLIQVKRTHFLWSKSMIWWNELIITWCL